MTAVCKDERTTMIGVKKLQDFSKAMIGPVLY
ncbi:hypothetical protein, partial [Klebsiella pneumoniae]